MRSMTGFGRGEASGDGWRVEAEIAGVNRKHLDISTSLPSALASLEAEIRASVTAIASRGRISVKINAIPEKASGSRLVCDSELARQYLGAIQTLEKELGTAIPVSAETLLRAPGVFALEENGVEPEALREILGQALSSALDAFVKMQQDEGTHLCKDLLLRLRELERLTGEIRELAPAVPVHHRKNLLARLKESGLDIDLDDERILREIALFAERCDISEELTRLGSHFQQFHTCLHSTEPMGRPLDFLCQELNRELNTIGSKANDAGIARRIVQARTELEKIREQVQNVQ